MSENTESKVTFTDNELKSIAANAMAKSSEAGDKAIMRIGLAVPDDYIEDGIITYPLKGSEGSVNSGFSIGVFQWDIGQQENGKEIIEAYNNSEYVKSGKGKSITKVDEYALVLQQNRETDRFGKKDTSTKRFDIRRDNKEIKEDYRADLARPLNNFFSTKEGYKFVSSLQERHYNEKLKPAMEEVLQFPSVKNMSKEDTVEVLAAIVKEKNQTGSIHKNVKELLENEKKLYTKDEIINKIYASHGKYVDDSVKNSLKGAELYNTLSNDKGVLGEIFKEYNKSNPIDMSDFHKSPNAQLIDAMFRHPEKAKELIEAVNNGTNEIININNEKNNMGIEKEVYIVGVKDKTIFTMQEIVESGKVTNSSKGYKLENNEWKEFDNNKERLLKLKNNDWEIDNTTIQKDNNQKLDTPSISKELTEFFKNKFKQDTLSEEFVECVALMQSAGNISDEQWKEFSLHPKVTEEMVEQAVKEELEKEQKELNVKNDKTKDDKNNEEDNVRRMS